MNLVVSLTPLLIYPKYPSNIRLGGALELFYNRYVQIANEHTAFSDLLTTTQCTVIEHSDYTPTTQHVSPWHELVINFSTQQSPTLRLCSASWGWANNVRNMSRLWTSIKWKVKCVSSWYGLLRNYVTMIYGQQNIKFKKFLSSIGGRKTCWWYSQ
jgi:hypothetical protein